MPRFTYIKQHLLPVYSCFFFSGNFSFFLQFNLDAFSGDNFLVNSNMILLKRLAFLYFRKSLWLWFPNLKIIFYLKKNSSHFAAVFWLLFLTPRLLVLARLPMWKVSFLHGCLRSAGHVSWGINCDVNLVFLNPGWVAFDRSENSLGCCLLLWLPSLRLPHPPYLSPLVSASISFQSALQITSFIHVLTHSALFSIIWNMVFAASRRLSFSAMTFYH